MTAGGLIPEGEALRRALAWLAGQGRASAALIDEASWRFDLSPLEAAVLFRYVSPAFEYDRPGTVSSAGEPEMSAATSASAPRGPLGPGQVAAFTRDGYVVVRGLFGAAEVADIRRWTDEVQAWPEVAGRHMMYFEHGAAGARILNRMENVLPWHEGFRRLANGAQLRGACGQLFGEPAVLFKDKINFKLPGGGGFDAHQDVQAGWSRYAPLHVTALVAVDRATVANGCLEVAANFRGRHTLIGCEWEPLTEQQIAGLQWTCIESEPGDVVFFDSFVPHRSAPNTTTEPRRVLYYTYNRASDGDHLERYYADKRASYPPDVEREPGREYRYRV